MLCYNEYLLRQWSVFVIAIDLTLLLGSSVQRAPASLHVLLQLIDELLLLSIPFRKGQTNTMQTIISVNILRELNIGYRGSDAGWKELTDQHSIYHKSN